MDADFYNKIQYISVMAIPVIFAITMHEAAHGWVANKLGDPTAKLHGRLTLNPLAHIDLFGTIILPIMCYLIADFVIGMAKPVPVNFQNLRNPKKDMIWVGAAGPAVNLAMALGCGILLQVLITLSIYGLAQYRFVSIILLPVLLMLKEGVKWNVLLAIFNLIPIPPLDGSRIMMGLLPHRQAEAYSRIEPYGLLIVIFLVFMNPLGFMSNFIWPIILYLSSMFAGGMPVF